MASGPACSRSRRAVCAGIVGLAWIAASKAEITLDGTLGAGGALQGPDFVVPASTGRTVGGNLFHSFSAFNLHAGERATFTGPDSLHTIISRVTGGSPSTIDGALVSEPQADFFFMNPNGVMFGDSASLDINGSFHVTTGDYVRLGGDGIYHADPQQDSVLTSAPPGAYGFLHETPASVRLTGARFEEAVPKGSTFSIVGGDIDASGSRIAVEQGRIHLVSVASPGEAERADGGVNTEAFATLGDVILRDRSRVDVSGPGAGSMAVRAGRLVASGGSKIVGETRGDGDSGVLDVHARGDITISGRTPSGFVSEIRATTADGSNGNTPGITLTADGTLRVDRQGRVVSYNGGSGAAGAIVIEAGSVQVHGPSTVIEAEANQASTATARGADLEIRAHTLTVGDRARVRTYNRGLGAGGRFSVVARDVIVQSDGNIASQNQGFGTVGDLVIDADRVRVQGNGSSITTNNLIRVGGTRGSALQGPSLSIDTSELLLEGDSSTGMETRTTVSGNAGTLTVRADRITIRGGARISASTGGSGNAGQVHVEASESIEVADTDSRGSASGIYSTAGSRSSGSGGAVFIETPRLAVANALVEALTVTDGAAGAIDVHVGQLQLTEGAQIHAFSGALDIRTGQLVGGNGRAGQVVVNATESVLVSGTNARGDPSGVLSQTRGSGVGGTVMVVSPRLTVEDGGLIGADTGGDGNAGRVDVNAEHLTVHDGGRISSDSGITVAGRDLRGSGAGGTVTVIADADVAVVGSDSTISTDTRGTGPGGNVVVRAPRVTVSEGGSISASSTSASAQATGGGITIDAPVALRVLNAALATETAEADGGNIAVSSDGLVYLLDSALTTSVAGGRGQGGNIDVREPSFVVLNRSQIIAQAVEGAGGNILIVTGQFLPSAGSIVDASSQFDVDGEVVIKAPETDVVGSVIVLPSQYLDTSGLLRSRCGATAGTSSLTDAGAGGLPANPDGYLPSLGMETGDVVSAAIPIVTRARGSAAVQLKSLRMAGLGC